MKGLLSGAIALLVVIVPALCGCGSSSSSSGEKVTCGPGTALDGGVCYVASTTLDGSAPDAADAGEDTGVPDSSSPHLEAGGMDASVVDAGPAAPTFGGVTSVGPASATSLQVTWAPATDAVTPAAAIVYDVYVATSAAGENFSAPTVTSPPGALSVDVQGLVMGSTYYVVVRARNQAHAEDKNHVEQSGKPQADTMAPAFAGATGASPAPQGSVMVSWAAAIDDLDPHAGHWLLRLHGHDGGGRELQPAQLRD